MLIAHIGQRFIVWNRSLCHWALLMKPTAVWEETVLTPGPHSLPSLCDTANLTELLASHMHVCVHTASIAATTLLLPLDMYLFTCEK